LNNPNEKLINKQQLLELILDDLESMRSFFAKGKIVTDEKPASEYANKLAEVHGIIYWLVCSDSS